MADASAEVRYTIDGFDGGFAIEKTSLTLLDGQRGGAPVSASAALFAMRVAFGTATERGGACDTKTVEAKEQVRAKQPEKGRQANPCEQIVDGDYAVALGWSMSLGARAGAVTVGDNASAVFAVEGVAEHVGRDWGAFGSLTAELVADNRTATTRYYGGAGAKVTLGARFGTFNRVGALVAAGARRWTHGPDATASFDYSLDVMLFGVFEQVRLGAGITRALNASADPGVQAFVPTVWLSPQI
ncbi:MAG: hypothetical protein R3B06_03360 [Kofleriaceae bacterium]